MGSFIAADGYGAGGAAGKPGADSPGVPVHLDGVPSVNQETRMRRHREERSRRGNPLRRRSRSAIGVALILLHAGCGSDDDGPPEDIGTCTIARLSDGDSLQCVEAGERVRLLLIDAPELAQAPWGDSAKTALEAILPAGRRVRLEYDAERRDDFGRLLAYLWLDDGRMVNEAMATAGYVVLLHYPPNDRYLARIRAAVDGARDARRGLWATTAFDCMPVDFRAGRCGAG
jgi:micrococcal nuclease